MRAVERALGVVSSVTMAGVRLVATAYARASANGGQDLVFERTTPGFGGNASFAFHLDEDGGRAGGGAGSLLDGAKGGKRAGAEREDKQAEPARRAAGIVEKGGAEAGGERGFLNLADVEDAGERDDGDQDCE